jgi:hypothetical protein
MVTLKVKISRFLKICIFTKKFASFQIRNTRWPNLLWKKKPEIMETIPGVHNGDVTTIEIY